MTIEGEAGKSRDAMKNFVLIVKDAKMKLDGFFWYSPEQEFVQLHWGMGLGIVRRFCNIKGQEYLYTEMMSGKYLREESKWPDAVCLGYGFVSRIENFEFSTRTPR